MVAKETIPAEIKLGFATRPDINPVTNSVATTATLILTNTPDRIFWLVINLSANKGYVGWDAGVASTKGIPIAANGGYVSCSVEEDGELVIYPVWAINENAAGTYYIVQIRRR